VSVEQGLDVGVRRRAASDDGGGLVEQPVFLEPGQRRAEQRKRFAGSSRRLKKAEFPLLKNDYTEKGFLEKAFAEL
jgi:transposase